MFRMDTDGAARVLCFIISTTKSCFFCVGQVLSVLNKGLYAMTVMDLHLHFIEDLQRTLSKARDDARRSFMKCVSLLQCVWW